MSKLKEYGFELVKRKLSNGEIIPTVSQKVPGGINSVLHFVHKLDKHETEGFIYDLDRCIDGQSNADEGFYSDSVESSDITYKYPNVNIGNVLIIPMIDMRAILVEWLNFAYA